MHTVDPLRVLAYLIRKHGTPTDGLHTLAIPDDELKAIPAKVEIHQGRAPGVSATLVIAELPETR